MSVEAAQSEALTRSEAKKHLEIAEAVTTHDSHIDALIIAVRELWEHDTHSITTIRTVTESDFSVGTEVTLSYGPVDSLTSVSFDSTVQTGTVIDKPRRVVHLTDGYSGENWNSVEIVYEAGYSTVPEIAKAAMKLQLSIMFDEHKNLEKYDRAYENLVRKFMRSTYP